MLIDIMYTGQYLASALGLVRYFSLAAVDPKPTWWQRLHVRSSGICSMHDDWCYTAELYLSHRVFNGL